MKKVLLPVVMFLFCTAALFAQKKGGAAGRLVPYTVAKNYFVKNTFQQGMLQSPKIESQETFDQYFGAAAFMGKDGKPTPIDFANQYVIVVIPPATDHSFKLSAKTLRQSGKTITLSYSYKLGKEQSSTSQPCLVLVVDKKYKGTVKTVRA